MSAMPFCGQHRRMRGELAPVAFDWLEVIVVRSGTALLTHRDDGRRQHVRPGDVVVLRPNVPCGIVPEGLVELSRLFYRPAFVVEQIRWADPLCLPDRWAAESQFERALPSQVVALAPPERVELGGLADRIVCGRRADAPEVSRLSLASWAIGVLGIVEDQLICEGLHGLFLGDDDVVNSPTEPCFGTLRPLRPEVRQAIKLIQARFSERLSLDELARAVHLSRPQFARVFTTQVGKTPKAYQDLLRVKRMAGLLLSTTMSVQAISTNVGWSNTPWAARVFKEATTMLPSEYRRTFARGPLFPDGAALAASPLTFCV
jgi:AraC-like DNA-binding protein